MDYTSLFNGLSAGVNGLLATADAAITTLSVPVTSAWVAAFTAIGLGELGPGGLAANYALAAGGLAGVVALGVTGYFAYHRLKNIFSGKAYGDPAPEAQPVAAVIHPSWDDAAVPA